MDHETCPNCGRSLGLFLPDETPICPGCGANLALLPEPPPKATQAIASTSGASATAQPQSSSTSGRTVLGPAPPSGTRAVPPAGQASRTSGQNRRPPEDQPFLCPPLLAVLGGTLLGLTCLCPLSFFLEMAKGLIMLAGICQILGGFLWMGYRFKEHLGYEYQDETPWFLRGGLATFLELGGLVVREPRVFGPPATVVFLGVFLTLLPIFLPGGMPSR